MEQFLKVEVFSVPNPDLVLIVSPEAPLMKQLYRVLGKLCTMYDFTTIKNDGKYITLRHDETGLVVAYTSEERLYGTMKRE